MSGKAPVIAIIDDDRSVRDATAGLVESLGYTAVSFSSAEDYLRSDAIGRTACLVSDVKMPGMSGMELQAHLLAEGVRVPVIFMTAFPSEQHREQALERGALGYLKKPFDEGVLIACLQRAMPVSPARSE